MSEYQTSLLFWGLVWLAPFVAIFLLMEIPAVADAVPWNTLTWTIRQTFARSQLFGLLFVGLTAVFITHLFWRGVRKKDEPEGDR